MILLMGLGGSRSRDYQPPSNSPSPLSSGDNQVADTCKSQVQIMSLSDPAQGGGGGMGSGYPCASFGPRLTSDQPQYWGLYPSFISASSNTNI
eukprot:CAMPEP_0179980206 /NCGR_PEP_ID=MMETSP0983-20121128/41805_1 /TAXON_ID=483367 /ORGANISM="non described non described, Strain CCMP 2436" /LENGTH=92 /DNA_ID=CAMNT_0021898117 /DNA_START=234 /DNA_END=512 /DNA_ORIENTATION=-